MNVPDPQMDKALRGPGSAGIPASLSGEAMQGVNKRLLVFVLGCLAYRNMQATTDSGLPICGRQRGFYLANRHARYCRQTLA